VVVHLVGLAGPVEAPQQAALLVEVHELLGLVVEDLEPLLDGLGLVVIALYELRAVLVADVLVLGRVELDVVDVAVLLADAPAREPPDDLLVGRLDDQRRRERAVALLE